MQTNEVIAGLQAEVAQQVKAQERVMALYAFEHVSLATPHEQRKKTHELWRQASLDLGPDLAKSVDQVGKALGHVYELQADSAYTIRNRLVVRRATRHINEDRESNGRENAKDPLAERLVDDIILARVVLEGNLRNPQRISAIAQDTRQTLGNKPFGATVSSVLEHSLTFFPTPSLTRRISLPQH